MVTMYCGWVLSRDTVGVMSRARLAAVAMLDECRGRDRVQIVRQTDEACCVSEAQMQMASNTYVVGQSAGRIESQQTLPDFLV